MQRLHHFQFASYGPATASFVFLKSIIWHSKRENLGTVEFYLLRKDFIKVHTNLVQCSGGWVGRRKRVGKWDGDGEYIFLILQEI